MIGGMNHATLTTEQYAPIIAKLIEQRDDLSKLIDRMKANPFPIDDPLFAAVSRAWQEASNACVVASTCRNEQSNVPTGRDDHDAQAVGGAVRQSHGAESVRGGNASGHYGFRSTVNN